MLLIIQKQSDYSGCFKWTGGSGRPLTVLKVSSCAHLQFRAAFVRGWWDNCWGAGCDARPRISPAVSSSFFSPHFFILCSFLFFSFQQFSLLPKLLPQLRVAFCDSCSKTHTHTHTLMITHTHTHTCWFCYTCGDSHSNGNGFCTVQTVYSIALHQPYT